MSEKGHVAVVGFDDEPLSRNERRLDAERVLAGDPHHKTRSQFEDADGRLVAGTWTSTPGKWVAFRDRDEFCYIVDGHVRLTDEDGHMREFKTGDAFLIPDGFRGTWEVVRTTTKHYVIRHHPDR